MKKIMIITISIILILIISVLIFINLPKFGKLPSGKRLELIKKSPNFKNDQFENQSFTPDLTGDDGFFTIMYNFFFLKVKNAIPKDKLPSEKINIKKLTKSEDMFVWFGHSSYYIQLDGKSFLIDPVFSGSASPVSFTTNSFNGSDIIDVESFDDIDYLIISHDHWDHLDYQSILKLKSKVGKVITGLGTGEHFEYWGYDNNKIIEKDWYESINLEKGFDISILPGRHFSGRGILRNKALWVSFALKTPTKNIFIGGDSGYDKHFKEIGEKYGPFDLSILECGQYNKNWKFIHMMPEETALAAKELNSKYVIPVHWSKFKLALHSWTDPISRFVNESKKYEYKTLTPMIGEKLSLDSNDMINYQSKNWWEEIK